MSTANSKLKIDYGFDSFGTSNVTGDFRVSGNVFIQGSILSSITTNGDFIPVTSGLLLGNNNNRWTLFSNSGNFSNTLTVTGAGSFQDELTVTKTINASNNVVITGFANATVSVNSALLTVGANFIANTTGAYHTGVVNAASHTVGTAFIANSTAIVGTGFANLTTSVNSALLTVGTSFIANTTGAYHTGVINAASHNTTGFVANTTAIVPTSNTILLGSSIGRFVLSANTGDFTGTVTGTTADMSTSVNSALLTVGANLIANSSVLYHTGVINAASHTTAGFVANTTAIAPTSNTILLGNATGRFVISANTADLSGQLTVSGITTLTGNATLNGTAHAIAGNVTFDSGTFFVDAANNRVGIANTTPSVALEVTGAANVSIGVNSALFTVGTSLTANTTGIFPGSNTVGTALGSSTNRWVLNANTINTSGLITGSAGANIAGQSNLVDVTISGNLTVSGTVTYINTTTLNVGDNIVTLNADLGAIAPTENAGLEVNRGSSANVSFLWNETSDSWTQGNTNITGYANASVSVNSALLTVGSSFAANTTGVYHSYLDIRSGGLGLIANTTGAYHTGTVNAASFTTSGLLANTTALVPTSNTILLGNTIGRFVISANTIDATGQVNASTGFGSGTINATSNGLFANASTISLGNSSVNVSINTSSVNVATHISGSINSTSNGLLANSTTVTVGNSSINVSITTAGITSSGGTGVNPTSNTVGTALGTNTQRWVLNANTINASGLITGSAGAAVTGQVNASTGFGSGTSNSTSIGLIANSTTILLGNTSAIFTANTTGAYHTGLINAASHTTSGFVANTTAIAPTSNTILLGNTIGRFVISANTIDASGNINSSGIINAASFKTTNFTANTTGVFPLSNTDGIILGSATNRFNLTANTGNFSGAITGTGGINIGSSGFIANSTAVLIANPLTANGSTGTAGQFLVSNGAAGSPYWSSGSVTNVADDTTTNGSRYLLFANQTSGSLSTAYVSSTQLSYNPSTGTLSSTVITGSSDVRLKTNIETIVNPVDTISKLRGVSFNRINNNHKDYGVIAQEIEKIIPDIVYTDAAGYKTVSYSSIIGFLIEAVKKQQQQIDVLIQDKYQK